MSNRLNTAAALGVLVLAIAPLTTSPAHAIVPTSTASLNVDDKGLAIQGYDLVAYFTDGVATKGDARFSTQHEGATYYFASARNLKRFKRQPTAYLPQFGGFCAMGTAVGQKIEPNPTMWKVVDGKLFLNSGQAVHERWSSDVAGNIAQANDNWPTIKAKTPAELASAQ